MKNNSHLHRVLLIIIVFIIIRIPILFFPDFFFTQGSLAQSIITNGYTLYCDFDKFTNSEWWNKHSAPPGIYIYMLGAHLTFDILAITLLVH